MNLKFKQAYAIAKAIKYRKNKALAIKAWCQAARKALGG